MTALPTQTFRASGLKHSISTAPRSLASIVGSRMELKRYGRLTGSTPTLVRSSNHDGSDYKFKSGRVCGSAWKSRVLRDSRDFRDAKSSGPNYGTLDRDIEAEQNGVCVALARDTQTSLP